MSGVLLIALNVLVSSRDDPVWASWCVRVGSLHLEDKEPKFYAAVGLPCICSILLALAVAKVRP